jgi:hypothetical protein
MRSSSIFRKKTLVKFKNKSTNLINSKVKGKSAKTTTIQSGTGMELHLVIHLRQNKELI